MTYLITFLEGILSFLSPCMLPLLPAYLSFFAGDTKRGGGKLLRIFGFILGFSISFILLGLTFAVLGRLLRSYRTIVDIVCGGIVILFGLDIIGVLHLPSLQRDNSAYPVRGFFSAVVFGIIYSVTLTPCVGAFLGSALMLAATVGSERQGMLLLLVYSLGLGIPFLLSALLAGNLDVLFRGIKSHYTAFNRICGGFLILMGIIIACGWMNRLIALYT